MTLSLRTITWLLTIGSAATILSAWGFQYLGYAPCEMCFWQRYPHMAAVVIGLFALVIGGRVWAWMGAMAMGITGGIGIFHSGVERGLWEGPTTCTNQGVDGLSTDELLDQIMNAPLVRCDEIAWQMFGVTMANLNVLASFAFLLGWLWVALRKPQG